MFINLGGDSSSHDQKKMHQFTHNFPNIEIVWLQKSKVGTTLVGMYTISSEGTGLLASRRRTSNNVAIEGSTEEGSNTGTTRESTGVTAWRFGALVSESPERLHARESEFTSINRSGTKPHLGSWHSELGKLKEGKQKGVNPFGMPIRGTETTEQGIRLASDEQVGFVSGMELGERGVVPWSEWLMVMGSGDEHWSETETEVVDTELTAIEVDTSGWDDGFGDDTGLETTLLDRFFMRCWRRWYSGTVNMYTVSLNLSELTVSNRFESREGVELLVSEREGKSDWFGSFPSDDHKSQSIERLLNFETYSDLNDLNYELI